MVGPGTHNSFTNTTRLGVFLLHSKKGPGLIMIVLTFLFFFALVMCLYVYVLYPILLLILGFLFRRPVRKGDIRPITSIIIPAHNEEKIIEKKIENTMSLDYPKDNVEVIVASDGSTDRTEEIVNKYEHLGIRLLSIPRVGKVKALNNSVPKAKGEIIVFTDANSILEADALKNLISNFSDPEVGGVCGNQKYLHKHLGDSSSKGENLYWSYDKWIKKLESQINSAVAADGSIYGLRKKLFIPISDPAQADDFAISAAVVTQGYRLVYDPEAISYENAPASSDLEFSRKVRVANQTINALLNLKQALNPFKYGFYAIELLSHKVLRYLVPFFLVIAFFTNIPLALESEYYKVLLVLQIVFYGFAFMGYRMRHLNLGRSKIFYGPFFFCLANIAVLIAALSVLMGKRITAWQPERE